MALAVSYGKDPFDSSWSIRQMSHWFEYATFLTFNAMRQWLKGVLSIITQFIHVHFISFTFLGDPNYCLQVHFKWFNNNNTWRVTLFLIFFKYRLLIAEISTWEANNDFFNWPDYNFSLIRCCKCILFRYAKECIFFANLSKKNMYISPFIYENAEKGFPSKEPPTHRNSQKRTAAVR